MFSIGMHCLLAVILIGSAAFRDRPDKTDAQILSLIPPNIIDQAGVGGSEPAPTMRVSQPQPQPLAQVQPQRQMQPQPREQVQPVAQPVVRRVERQKPQEEEEETRPLAVSDNPAPRPKTHHHEHEIHPTFTPAARITTHRTAENTEATEEASAASAARAEARRRSEIENSLDHLASNVRTSGAGKTTVDIPGIGGGGEAFAGYRDVIRSIYYRAWVAPENGGDKSAAPEARIVVARDGTILSAEIVSASGDSILDKSVSRTLRIVTKLPPFPAVARDEQRTFRLQFSLDLKEASG
ncbi:MAG TPA: TonB family protein [Verrucomicrobiae bacterium]|nr:TonB family protein [Verrucomicrobiae bacterium]